MLHLPHLMCLQTSVGFSCLVHSQGTLAAPAGYGLGQIGSQDRLTSCLEVNPWRAWQPVEQTSSRDLPTLVISQMCSQSVGAGYMACTSSVMRDPGQGASECCVPQISKDAFFTKGSNVKPFKVHGGAKV